MRFYRNNLPATPCFIAMCLLSSSPFVNAQDTSEENALNRCLQARVIEPENNAKTVAQLRSLCAIASSSEEKVSELIVDSPAALISPRSIIYSEDPRNSFFQPYKNNYISLGSMKNEDGQDPFSGKTFDLKFELGMKFGLFPDLDGLEPLSPIKFGYSQRSWWDIAEQSAPFKEHNYNPEIFWDFTEALAIPSSAPRLHIFDLLGVEHQSNGLDGLDSRSWDRVYATRTLRMSEVWSWTFKYWHVLNLGDYNEDIEDYLGNAEITTHFDVNNWARVDFKTLLGRKSDKLSYKVDLIVPMSRWINSRFLLSYYSGYGEALISYNKKTTSLRAGFYFPLGF